MVIPPTEDVARLIKKIPNNEKDGEGSGGKNNCI